MTDREIKASKVTEKAIGRDKLRIWLRPKVSKFLGSKADSSKVDSLTSKAMQLIKKKNWTINPLHAPSIKSKQVTDLLKEAQGGK